MVNLITMEIFLTCFIPLYSASACNEILYINSAAALYWVLEFFHIINCKESELLNKFLDKTVERKQSRLQGTQKSLRRESKKKQKTNYQTLEL